MNELTREQIPSHGGKWSQELVWVARNDRGDIIRAQDMTPQDAVKQAEEIHKRFQEEGVENESNNEGL